MLELLAPAGSPEAVTAAVQNGADAVYLSFDDLTDCRRAVNFSDNAFEASVRYCRVRGCKVYLALNTPVWEDETQKAGGLALRAQRAGVDAVIVRDLGTARILRSLLPDMPLFADAALGFFTPEAVKEAGELGFTRVFLPREMPLEEIRRASAVGVETAVFVQTSLCASGTGLCRMSAIAGRESADRGLCSELCRESYTFGGRWDSTPLSYKDRCLLRSVKELEEMGVTCAVIGDRDRRPEYTADYTRVFYEAIKENRQCAEAEKAQMDRVFLPFGAAETAVYEPAGERNRPDRRMVERYCTELRKKYSENELRRVGVEFAVVARSADECVRLGVQDNEGHQSLLEGPMPDPLGDLPITEDAMTEAMYRTAGTPFRCDKVTTVAPAGLSVSGMELDAARRHLLYKLSEARAADTERTEGEFPAEPYAPTDWQEPLLNLSFRSAEQMTPELAALRPGCIYVPIELMAEQPERLLPFAEQGATVVAELPAMLCGEDEEAALLSLIQRVRVLGVEEALCGNLGIARFARQAGLRVRGDMALNVTNAYTMETLAERGFLSAAVSPELTLRQVKDLPKIMDTELVAYGRLPVMITPKCLLKTSAGRCTCTTPGQMADTHGGVWPVTKHFGCRNTVWARSKLWLGDMVDDWIGCGLWAVRLVFSTESPRECLEVAECYMHGTDYRPNGMTRGLYYRGTL